MKELEHSEAKQRKELEKKDRRSRVLALEHQQLKKTSAESAEAMEVKVQELTEQLTQINEEFTSVRDKLSVTTEENQEMNAQI